jgi:predicted O-methyltransferase YrrM
MALYPETHFYSPYQDPKYVVDNLDRIYHTDVTLPGIQLNIGKQMLILELSSENYKTFNYPENKSPNARYYTNNGFYEKNDGLILQTVMQYSGAKQIIEVGSGFSSALMLDERDKSGSCGGLKLTFIEPNPHRLNSLLKKEDKLNTAIHVNQVQNVDKSIFNNLEAGDILFIDSSHVTKAGNDLNYLLFDIIPGLNKGVYIHFHDVFYPFEYPLNWVKELRGWNENYLLRAFLMYNNNFEVVFFNDYMIKVFGDEFEKRLPGLMLPDGNGGNLWLRKL